MITTLAPAAAGTRFFPRGLTAADLARIVDAMAAERAASTRRSYESAWRCFARWCAERGLDPLPAQPAVVCAYLTERAERGLAFGTLSGACAAIAARHRGAGLPDPIAHEAVRKVRRGLRRILGVAPRRQSRALFTDDIRQIVAAIDSATPSGARDRALILLGFASALRRIELRDLALADVAVKPAGLLITVRRSKGDPDGEGQLVAVATGQHAATDPVAALAAWLQVRSTAPGPLFTRVRRYGVASLDPISDRTVAEIIKARARGAGLSDLRVSGHSLRAGHATSAALAGVPLDRIAAQTRHKNVSTLVEHYIRPVQILATTSSHDLGL
jgi:integrase